MSANTCANTVGVTRAHLVRPNAKRVAIHIHNTHTAQIVYVSPKGQSAGESYPIYPEEEKWFRKSDGDPTELGWAVWGSLAGTTYRIYEAMQR